MKIFVTKFLPIALFLATTLLSGAGPITVVGAWRLGEADPGATPGGPANTTQDSSGGGDTLSVLGSPAPVYSSLSFAPVGSSRAILFSGNSGFTGTPITTATNNFGIEIWAFPTSSGGNRAVIYNGNTSNAGYGIYQTGSNWALLYGGILLQSSAPVTLNQWADLALVRDTGSATLYVNGVPFPLTAVSPNPVSGNMLIGMNQGGTERFVGTLDEGRIFTFSGGFNTSNLLINAAAPTSTATGAPALSPWGTAILGMLLLVSAVTLLRRANLRA